MTEGGLLSSAAFKAMAAENFVCVRLFSTALGGGHEQVRKFLPGISDELRRRLMYQGNSVLVLTPDGKIVTTRYEAVDQSPRLQEADVQMEEKVPGGLMQLRQVMKHFPAAGKPAAATPWQFSPAHALVVAWDDNRRVVAVPSRDGRINPALEKSLADLVLLTRFQSRYVFVKVGPEHAPPAEVRKALDRVGEGGLLVLDIPKTDVGCVGSGKDQHYQGPWSEVRAAVPGPHTAESLAKLLREHLTDLPTYVSQKCEKTRREGKHVRTGLEEFDVIWKGAPASVRRLWSKADVEDMREYTSQALARPGPRKGQ
jgi:hypothetical protein